MGFMTGDEAGQDKTLTLFWHEIVWLFTRCVRTCIVMLKNTRSVILHEMINYLLCMNPVKPSKNGCWLKRLRGWINVLTRYWRNVVTSARPGLARTLIDPVLLYWFTRLWIDCLEQPKWCAIKFTVDPGLSTPKTWFLWSFERRTVTICKRVVTINCFLLSVLSCKCFLVGFKAVSEPPVPEHVQRKEHVFQSLTLE